MGRDGSELVNANIALLRSGSEVLTGMEDRYYACAVPAMPALRIGAHLRHILEYYDCFLEGLASGVIDYENRRRDRNLEVSRSAATAKLNELSLRLGHLDPSQEAVTVRVRAEDDPATSIASTIGRELQVLSSHTVHHYALIAVALQAFGLDVPASFGVARSTLRHRDGLVAAEAAA